nr:hypothetical protein [uncultured Desulfobacter sp.]
MTEYEQVFYFTCHLSLTAMGRPDLSASRSGPQQKIKGNQEVIDAFIKTIDILKYTINEIGTGSI